MVQLTKMECLLLSHNLKIHFFLRKVLQQYRSDDIWDL